MSLLKKFTKQPIDRLDYDFEYSAWLSENDTVLSAEIVVEALGDPVAGTPLVVETVVTEPTYVKAWVSGGVSGVTYKLSCTVTTDKDRIKQDEIKIRVKDY